MRHSRKLSAVLLVTLPHALRLTDTSMMRLLRDCKLTSSALYAYAGYMQVIDFPYTLLQSPEGRQQVSDIELRKGAPRSRMLPGTAARPKESRQPQIR